MLQNKIIHVTTKNTKCYAMNMHTVRSNQNGWKAILWSKIRVFWHCINHLKSVANHSFKILCFKKNIGIWNEVMSILVSQGADKVQDVKVWGLIKNLLQAHSNTFELSKSGFEWAHTRIFSNLKLWHLVSHLKYLHFSTE